MTRAGEVILFVMRVETSPHAQEPNFCNGFLFRNHSCHPSLLALPPSSPAHTAGPCMWLICLAMTPSVLYEKGDWSSLWWLPKPAGAPAIGSQVAIEDGRRMPHLIFVPAGEAPTGGWPLLIFLHGQGESQGAAPLANRAMPCSITKWNPSVIVKSFWLHWQNVT